MKHKILSLMLVAALALGLAVPALAYNTKDFVDVPKGNWAYDAVMKMADAGVINGVGGGKFDPNGQVTAEQFITLVGRIVFPEVKASGSDWSGPYVAEAKAKGMLTGTTVTDGNLKSAITRYDMAVILRAAAKLLEAEEKLADPSTIGDYGMTPAMYADAVRAVYGAGLITGDDKHNFNGQNSMRRSEAATVMSRLIALKPGGSTGTTPEQPTDPVEDPDVDYEVAVYLRQTEHAMAAPAFDKHTYLPGVSAKLYYTSDSGETSTLVGEGVSVSENRWDEEAGRNITVGYVVFQFKAPESWSKGKNFYVSAETVYEGQKLVTSDLRTDGRAFKNLFAVTPGPSYSGGLARFTNVELTPPTGEKAKLTYKGVVTYFSASDEQAAEGFTVRLHFKDGVVLGEAVTDANGHFAMDFEVDALDNPFDELAKQYYVTIEGVRDGVRYAITPEKNGKVALTSLYVLGVCVPMGSGKWINEDSIIRFTSLDAVSP